MEVSRVHYKGSLPVFCIVLLELCPVGGRRRFGLAYRRTRGSLTITSGGEKGNGINEIKGRVEMRGRPVLRSMLELGDSLVSTRV